MRRLFSPVIVESDAFLDMPLSTQALYFHLGMNADDDGFVNPKKIMRLIGTTDDELKILLAKRFVLLFESGVIVIKHWLIHNSIRKDRYNETQYVEEKKSLFIKANKAYSELGKPNGNQMATIGHTQVKLSKVKLSNTATKVAREFNFKEKLNSMKIDPDKRMLIIAYYWYFKEWKFENEEQYSSALRRELRPAKDLIGFTIKQISSSMEFCAKEYKVWTLETVAKRINDLIANKN